MKYIEIWTRCTFKNQLTLQLSSLFGCCFSIACLATWCWSCLLLEDRHRGQEIKSLVTNTSSCFSLLRCSDLTLNAFLSVDSFVQSVLTFYCGLSYIKNKARSTERLKLWNLSFQKSNQVSFILLWNSCIFINYNHYSRSLIDISVTEKIYSCEF